MRRIVRGIRRRGFDEGTLWMIGLVGLGFAAGLEGGRAGWGGAVMAALIVPLWLSGCWYAGGRD